MCLWSIIALRSPSTRIDFYNGAELVFFPAEHFLEFQFFHRYCGKIVGSVNLLLGGIAGFPEFLQDLQIVQLGRQIVVSVRPDLSAPDVFENGFSLFRIVPEIRLLGYSFFVFDLGLLAIVVKDTPSKRPVALSSLSIAR